MNLRFSVFALLIFPLAAALLSACDSRPKTKPSPKKVYSHPYQALDDRDRSVNYTDLLYNLSGSDSIDDAKAFGRAFSQCKDELFMIEGLSLAYPIDFKWSDKSCQCIKISPDSGHVHSANGSSLASKGCQPFILAKEKLSGKLRDDVFLPRDQKGNQIYPPFDLRLSFASSEDPAVLDRLVLGKSRYEFDAGEFYGLIEICVNQTLANKARMELISHRDQQKQELRKQCFEEERQLKKEEVNEKRMTDVEKKARVESSRSEKYFSLFENQSQTKSQSDWENYLDEAKRYDVPTRRVIFLLAYSEVNNNGKKLDVSTAEARKWSNNVIIHEAMSMGILASELGWPEMSDLFSKSSLGLTEDAEKAFTPESWTERFEALVIEESKRSNAGRDIPDPVMALAIEIAQHIMLVAKKVVTEGMQ